MLIDRLIDEGPQLAGTLELSQVHLLSHAGLVYFDVPVSDNDYVYGRSWVVYRTDGTVPWLKWLVSHLNSLIVTTSLSVAPLDGFVMNRVLGDYFETLLYKIFVAIDDQTTVSEVGVFEVEV